MPQTGTSPVVSISGDIDELAGRARSLRDRLPAAVAVLPGDATNAKRLALAVLGLRLADLIDGIVGTVLARQVVPPAILARATIETAAAIHYAAQAPADLPLGLKILAGSKSPDFVGDAIQPVHVADLVRALKGRWSGLVGTYDALSEWVHPNYAGALGAFGDRVIDEDRLRYVMLDRRYLAWDDIRAASLGSFDVYEDAWALIIGGEPLKTHVVGE